MEKQAFNPQDSGQLIDSLNRQIKDLQSQVKSAALEMEMMRARMSDLRRQAENAADVERFFVPDDTHMQEINETVALMDRAIKKERKSRRAASESESAEHSTTPQKLDERQILIVLKLRRKGCYIREIAAHTGLAHGTVHNIVSRYGSDPQMQELITEGTQMELTDYLIIRPEED